jgi:Domain of unknown function (DUF3427)
VAWAEETQTDALMVNLHKPEKESSPTTMYRDYAFSPELIHWESQNITSTDSTAGDRYVRHRELGAHVVLFVRDAPRDEIGGGERPIAITWRLHRPIPADTFATASVVAR